MAVVDSSSRFVHFPPEEVVTLAAIAKQAAVIIENARLFEQEQRQRQRAEALVEVLTATASTYGLKKVLIKLCQAVVNLSVGDRCSILMTGEDGRSLIPVMSLGIEDQDLWQRFRNPAPGENAAVAPEHRRLQAAIDTWENPIVMEDAAKSGLMTRWWVDSFNLKSLALYPLRVKDRTIGSHDGGRVPPPCAFPPGRDRHPGCCRQAGGCGHRGRAPPREGATAAAKGRGAGEGAHGHCL